MEKLQKIVQELCETDLPRHSRIHPLSTLFSSQEVFVKREDELGCLASGSKTRKYLSLLPFLKQNQIEEVILLGGPFSNHILHFSQLLLQNQITPTLFLQGPPPRKPVGNFLWTLLCNGKRKIHWITKEKWQDREEIAKKYAQNHPNRKIAILPEGGSSKETLAGLLTLPIDILENEKHLGSSFSHIFVDSGTGMTASVLLLAFSYLERPTHIHILLTAGTKEEFLANFQLHKKDFEDLVQRPVSLPSCSFYKPRTAPAFGSWNKAVLEEIQFLAENVGMLSDPVYSGKFFLESRSIIQEKELSGKILLIHSGGSFSLSGFQEPITSLLRKTDSTLLP